MIGVYLMIVAQHQSLFHTSVLWQGVCNYWEEYWKSPGIFNFSWKYWKYLGILLLLLEIFKLTDGTTTKTSSSHQKKFISREIVWKMMMTVYLS